MQPPCNLFANQVAPVPFPGMQAVPAAVPPAIQQCVLPRIPSTPANEWHGSYAPVFNRFPDPVMQSNFSPGDNRFKPRPSYVADVKNSTSHSGIDQLKQDSGVRSRHSDKSALIKAIADSAVWIPTVDSSIPKTVQKMPESLSSNLSETAFGNRTKAEKSLIDSSRVSELAEEMVRAVKQEEVSDVAAEVEASPTSCLWGCVPVTAVHSETLAAMEARGEAEGWASDLDSRGKKRRRGSDGTETRRRSSRLRTKEEQRKHEKVDDSVDNQPLSDPASKTATDAEQSKSSVMNLKARILQDYESDVVNPNPSTTEDSAASASSFADAEYKVPAEPCSPVVSKPEKVKSRWRRWSELESDGDQGQVGTNLEPTSCQSPSFMTPTTSALDDKDAVEEKPPYFEPVLDNIFLSMRLVSL